MDAIVSFRALRRDFDLPLIDPRVGCGWGSSEDVEIHSPAHRLRSFRPGWRGGVRISLRWPVVRIAHKKSKKSEVWL